MITERQKTLVQETWEKVKPIAPQAAEIFYGKLFEMDPSLKPLFKGDMAAQGEKLMKTLNFAVTGLRNLSAVVPAVQDLGKRHVGYGVKKEHYATVGGALLGTLEAGLGSAFTPEVKEAWTAVYTALSSIMIDSAGYELVEVA